MNQNSVAKLNGEPVDLTSVSGSHPFGRIGLSPFPPLSVYNGSSSLLRAVEFLEEQGALEANVRFLPVIAEALCPEIVPYRDDFRHDVWVQTMVRQYERLFEGSQKKNPSSSRLSSEKERVFSPENLVARLGVNVRPDNRLLAYFPLVRLGLVSGEDVFAWEKSALSPRQGYAQAVLQKKASYLEREVGEEASDTTLAPSTPPEMRLAQQIAQLLGLPREPNERNLLPVAAYRKDESRWERHFYLTQGQPDPTAFSDAYGTVQGLIELFYTWAMMAIATADNLVGLEYVLPLEPKGRVISLEINGRSSPKEIARWLHHYPHYPRLSKREKGEPGWDWQEDDFGIQQIHKELTHFYGGKHEEAGGKIQSVWRQGLKANVAPPPLSPEGKRDVNLTLSTQEILARVSRQLPQYVPNYPTQSMITGGLNLEGILISLMEKWRTKESFLGIDQQEWERIFSPVEGMILSSLLVLRTQVPDQRLLFQEAAKLLIHSEIEVWQEVYAPRPTRLGTPLAQLNGTLTLKKNVVLHAPEMILRIPLDETRDEQEPEISEKIRVLQRLFLPVHLPLRAIWNVNRPRLGKTAFLNGKASPTHLGNPAPVSRVNYNLG